MSSWHSPQSIYSMGHKAVVDLLHGEVTVEEKVDGSFCAFGVYDGELRFRSKGQVMVTDAPEKMFVPAIESARSRLGLLREGWQYRGEFLRSPKHNSLAYSRIPRDHVIIFDICTEEETYLPWDAKVEEAERIGLEVAPLLYEGVVRDPEMVREFLERESVLGGQKIEGVVIKSYSKFGPDKKALFAKHVSEVYKEVHATEWKKSNPGSGDVIQGLITKYRTPARWAKSVQHLREAGLLTESPRDIGLLIKEVQADIRKECADEIRDALWSWAWDKVRRGTTAGLPEWWIEELLDRSFDAESAHGVSGD